MSVDIKELSDNLSNTVTSVQNTNTPSDGMTKHSHVEYPGPNTSSPHYRPDSFYYLGAAYEWTKRNPPKTVTPSNSVHFSFKPEPKNTLIFTSTSDNSQSTKMQKESCK